MCTATTNITGFNKSKEDFIWFIKKATSDRKSDAHGELFHCLLKMFIDADTNEDGLVSKGSFSKLIDMAASIPRMYGYAPLDADLYKTVAEKEKARQKMFDSMDLKTTGVITFDEWYKFCMEHIAAKVATLAPHPILDHGNKEEFLQFLKAAVKPGTPEHTEMFWYLVELFTESDSNKDGIITKRAFANIMDKVFETPNKLGLVHPDEGMYEKDEDKKAAFQDALFKADNPVGDEKMTLDEWILFAMEKVFKKFLPHTATTNVTGFNKSKEDFIWFIKRASSDPKSDARCELYHCLLKMFVDCDTNKDGLVSRASFSKLIDMAASIPRMYGYAPSDSELYKTEGEKEKARQKMFDSMDLKSTGVITFDEWYDYSMKHIIAKTATIPPHPILDHGNKEAFLKVLKIAVKPGTPEHTEMFWFLTELFTDSDFEKKGVITITDKKTFATIMDKLFETPTKLGLVHPDKGMYEKDATKKAAFLNTLFRANNPRGDEKMTLDEWILFAMEKVFKVFIK